MAMYKIETLILLKLMLQIEKVSMITTCLKKLMNNRVMRRIIQEYEDEKGDLKLILKLLKMFADRIYIIAGTSYHAGLVGKEYLENGVYLLKYM